MPSYNPATQKNKKIAGLRPVGNKIKEKTTEVNKAGRACTLSVYLPIQATHGTLHSPALMDGTRGPRPYWKLSPELVREILILTHANLTERHLFIVPPLGPHPLLLSWVAWVSRHTIHNVLWGIPDTLLLLVSCSIKKY